MASWWGNRNQFRELNGREIDPEDIFLDSSNVAKLDASRLEGRIERPVSRAAIIAVGAVFSLVLIVFLGQAVNLQIFQGQAFADISRNNRIDRSVIFAPRGIIYDRNSTELAWNAVASAAASASSSTSAIASTTASTTADAAATSATSTDAAEENTYAARAYIARPGFSHLLGFVRYPKADAAGQWWREDYDGVAGAERVFNDRLMGKNGSRLAETDARGKFVREDIVDPPQEGQSIHLSIDADVQSKLTEVLEAHAANQGFKGGAAAIMDVHTGELLALTSFPEYDSGAFSRGDSEAIAKANTDPATPLLNRAVGGLYTPGSIVKPLFAAAALEEGIIDPLKSIYSAGSISIPNPYDPSRPSIFKDWKAHGYVDMRRAIAVSSDVYFYAIGGGFQDQKGLGILKIDEWARKFGLGSFTGFLYGNEAEGIIPTPEWKEKVFDGDPWRLGDTYNTAIGQYGFQITPLQAVRFTAALANGGTLLKPQIEHGALPETTPVGVSDDHLQIVREGMRHGVTDGGTAAALNISGLELAGKTGTAQVGMRNEYMNSWVIGFWPASAPKYAFAVVLEKAPANTLSGAAPAMSNFFYWLRDYKPDYAH